MATLKATQKKVDKVNALIAQALADDVDAVEVDSTWESVYTFEPVRIVRKSVKFTWTELYPVSRYEPVKHCESINYENEMLADELAWMFQWVARCINKGYREAARATED